MINKVILIGNLGKDPEIRRLENGTVVGKFSVATNESYKDKNGEFQTETEWHDVVVWRHLAERAEKDFTKGKLVYIEGKLTHRKYVDKNEITRYQTEVVAKVARLLEKKPEGSGSGFTQNFPENEPGSNVSTPAPTSEPAKADDSGDTDDLPF